MHTCKNPHSVKQRLIDGTHAFHPHCEYLNVYEEQNTQTHTTYVLSLFLCGWLPAQSSDACMQLPRIKVMYRLRRPHRVIDGCHWYSNTGKRNLPQRPLIFWFMTLVRICTTDSGLTAMLSNWSRGDASAQTLVKISTSSIEPTQWITQHAT